jgi:putative transposase
VRTWREAWERFIPFLEFAPQIRKIIYTTNSIESLNYQLRKIIKNRGHFPNDDAVAKLLWLAIRDIEAKRAAERAKEAGLAKNQPRKAPPRLVEGGTVQGWNQALGALAIAFPGRLEATLLGGVTARRGSSLTSPSRRRAAAVKMQRPTGRTILTAPSTGTP